MKNEILPSNVIKFSFICDNTHARQIKVMKHGSANITKEQYKQIIDIIYGTTET